MTELSLRLRRALCLLAIGGLLTACFGQPATRQSEPMTGPAAVSAATQPTERGPTADDEPVQFTVSLRLPGAADLDTYLRGLATPGSSSYQHYLAPAEFGARFGLSDERLAAIVAWLQA